jgi:hypothetical protein
MEEYGKGHNVPIKGYVKRRRRSICRLIFKPVLWIRIRSQKLKKKNTVEFAIYLSLGLYCIKDVQAT